MLHMWMEVLDPVWDWAFVLWINIDVELMVDWWSWKCSSFVQKVQEM